jgi:hypothetical protein
MISQAIIEVSVFPYGTPVPEVYHLDSENMCKKWNKKSDGKIREKILNVKFLTIGSIY